MGRWFWLWLSVRYAGIQAGKYVGEITCLEEGGRARRGMGGAVGAERG